MAYPYIYLASKSPRRSELLGQLGVSFKMLLADASEDAEGLEQRMGRESPRHYVQRVTALKAGAALLRLKERRLQSAPILVADTTVAIGNKIFGKPDSDLEAIEFLQQLSGRSHLVLTAVAVALNRRLDIMLSASRVTLRSLGSTELRRYVATGEHEGKAGAYGMQGRAAAFVTHISGSHSGIVGLPLAETAQLLRSFRVEY